MRYLLLAYFSLVTMLLNAQIDSARPIEPDMETSFENYELLILAIVGLLLLIGIRMWFRRTRKHR